MPSLYALALVEALKKEVETYASGLAFDRIAVEDVRAVLGEDGQEYVEILYTRSLADGSPSRPATPRKLGVRRPLPPSRYPAEQKASEMLSEDVFEPHTARTFDDQGRGWFGHFEQRAR